MPAPRINQSLLRYVEDRLASAVPFGHLSKECQDRFQVSRRTVSRYVRRVYDRWEALEKEDLPRRRVQFRARLDLLWRKAIEAGDYRAAAQVLRQLAKLDGLEVPVQHQVSGQVGVSVAALSPAERQAEIERLLAQRQRVIELPSAPDDDEFGDEDELDGDEGGEEEIEDEEEGVVIEGEIEEEIKDSEEEIEIEDGKEDEFDADEEGEDENDENGEDEDSEEEEEEDSEGETEDGEEEEEEEDEDAIDVEIDEDEIEIDV